MLQGFDPAVRKALIDFIEKTSRTRSAQPPIAVFDADGTLWRGDLGEAFFRYQVEKRLVPHAPKRNPWQVYLKETLEGEAEKAFGWLAQWNRGTAEGDLLRWSRDFFTTQWLKNVFPPMRELCHLLLNAGFELWVVSGSIRWVIEAGAEGFGIRPDRIIATEVEVAGGRLTDKLHEPVPYRGGKAKLIQKLIQRPPVFAAGNTSWDKDMLALATGLVLTIHSEGKEEPNYGAEQRLRKHAESKGWLIQHFAQE